MVIHDYNTIFVHVPKTGGISLTHAIMTPIVGYDTSGQIGKLSKELKLKFEMRGHQKHDFGKNFVKNNHVSQSQWDQYYKFAFVRNPWDRTVSEFHWRHQLKNGWEPSEKFEEFLQYCKARINDKTNRKRDIYWTHAQMQSDYVTDSKGKFILDDVYKFEELDESSSIISNKTGMKIDLKRHNSSKHLHYSEYYNTKTKNMITDMYREDIERFEYEFGK